jgi:hypothetical protein
MNCLRDDLLVVREGDGRKETCNKDGECQTY